MNPAHPHTLRAHAALASELDFTDRRGFIDTLDEFDPMFNVVEP